MSKDYHTDNKTFQVYKNWEEFVLELDNNEQIGELFKALFAFAKRGEEAEFKGALKMAFAIMRQTIESDGIKWENTCNSRSEAGKKGGRPAKAKKANAFFDNQTKAKKAKKADIDIDIDIDIDNIPPISPKGDKPEIKPETDSFSESFNDFWKAYPKKVSKTNALKAWNKLKPDDSLVREILSALEKQKQSSQWQKDNGQFIPYPATWLNGRRWEDEQQAVSSMPDYSYGTEGVDYL